ncbi:MAG: HlyD family secretion protein [Pseudomonadota bacterium]
MTTDAPVEPPPPARSPPNRIRRVTLAVLLIAAALFVYGLIADRLTPYSDQATVQAYVVRLAPDIAGRVSKVEVVDNQLVKAGQVLFALDPERYEIAAETAEAQLAVAGQSVGASTAGLAAAEANLAQAQAGLANTRQQSARTLRLVETGFETRSRGDQAKALLASSVAGVGQARAEVERARQNLGPGGSENPQVRQAQAALRKARRDVADTVVRAPADGVVTNLQLAPGQFVGAGQPALTFFDSAVIWVDAEMEENALEHIKVGDPVDIVLDIRPGRVYRGQIESVAWGVDSQEIDPQTGLPTVRNDSGWIREPQRFPVRVRFDPERRPTGVRLGSQADIVVYTGENGLTDGIGRLWILLVSAFSYIA